jgi:diguanylate cyclase (GGDEF)-like protein
MAEKFFKFGLDTVWLILAVGMILYAALRYDVVETVAMLVNDHHELQLNEILITLLCALFFILIFVIRRLHELGTCRCRLLDTLREINTLSTTDRLTGLNNRRYFVKIASRDVGISLHAGGSPLVAMIDIDHCTSLNDAYGQVAGDQILQKLAKMVDGNLEETDLAGRYRGPTFIILLGDCAIQDAVQRFERLRQEIFDSVFFIDQHKITTSISIGIGSKNDGTQSLSDLINDAEIALYEAKDSGRNRVVHR